MTKMTWPHTWVVPKHAAMGEKKQIAPWSDRPAFIDGTDRPAPLLHHINGGESTAKRLRAGAADPVSRLAERIR